MMLTEGWEPCRRCGSKGTLEEWYKDDLRYVQPCPICGGVGKLFLADPWGWKRTAVGKDAGK